MSFLSDSGDDEPSLSSFQQEIYDQLLSGDHLPEPPPPSGHLSDPMILSRQQPLFLIVDFFEAEFNERIVRLWAGAGHEERFVHLRDQWCKSRLSLGDPAFVIGDWVRRSDRYGSYTDKLSVVVDASSGFLIVLPHVLIQSTKLAACQECERQAYLQDIIPGASATNMVALVGTLVHNLIEKLVGFGLLSTDLETALDNLLDSQKYTIFLAGETVENVREKVEPYLPILRQIGVALERKFDTTPMMLGEAGKVYEAIEKLPPYGLKCVRTEENLWSFQWGLKGTIDMTLEHRKQLFPVELKSGSCMTGPRESHILQLSGYIFMLKEKYGEHAGSSGALFYAKNSVSFKVAPRRAELAAIILKRNCLAHAIAHGTVPETSGDVRACRFCGGKEACAFLEDSQTRRSPIGNVISDYLCYKPAPHHHQFYEKWEQTLLEELMVARNAQTCLWLTPVERRVRSGRAVAGLKVVSIGDNLVEFQADPHALARSCLGVSSRIMLTRRGVPPIVGRGDIRLMREDSIHIELNESDLIDGDEGICADIWESTHSVDICRRNLMALFASEPTLTGVRLRELVVDMAPPRFDPLPPASSVNIEGDLNEDQMLAMRTAACALDYMLLLGMPGTGKTTTIAAMIKAMVADGQTILIASYTHTAVDNLCLKLIELGVEFIRIGRAESFHSDVARYALETIVEGASGVDDISKAIDYCRVFATTCLGFQHPVIQSRIYDLCVIDEASQINLPTVLGPLSRSRRFILVGDHYQLSPIKKHDAAMHEDAPSLFRVLCEAHPHALVTLRTQYRMNAEIMRLCNELIYGFRMRCGISAVARGRLSLARLEVFTRFEMFHQNWIRFALESEPPVLFYDTDPVPMHERRGQGSKVNHGEAAVASAIVVALVLCGLDPSQIGVISPYRAQVLYMRDAVTKQLQSVAKFFPHLVPDVKQLSDAIECHTVDKFQGRDKECILFSSVKSNRRLNPGNHITDWQRLNVAVTRAKTKFILIGSRETLSRAPVFSDLFKLLSPQNVVLLPNEIDQANAQPFGAMPMIANPHGDES